MPITAAQLVAAIQVTGATEAKAQLESVGQQAEKTGGGFKNFLGGALSMASGLGIANVVGQGIGFLKDQIGDMFQQSMDAQAGLAQTVQVLKSTHDASGMTAQSVLDLATQYSHLTQFSDDTVQASENMLLTFSNIGKNVFPQATKTVLDMSQALGQDTKNSAIQLGKALNDPLTGITALQRVGVTFTQGQKDSIAAMMKHGDIASAQGVILKELQKEFGGSAEAAGKTFPGQLKILGQNFDDLKQNIGDAVIPILSRLVSWVTGTVVPALGRFGDWFSKNALPVLQQFGGFIQSNVLPILQQFGAWFVTNAIPKLQQFGDIIKTQVFPVIQNLMSIIGIALAWLKDHWTQIWGILGPIVKGVFDQIAGTIKIAWSIISGIIKIALDILKGNWGAVWTDLKNMLAGVWDGIVQVIKGRLETIWAVVHGALTLLGNAFSGLGTLIHGVWDGIIGAIKGAINGVIGIINSFISGVDAIHVDVGPVHIGFDIPTIPYLQSGGFITSPGLAYLHAGERVVPSGGLGAGVSSSGPGGGQMINLYLDGYQFARLLLPHIVNNIRNGVGITNL